MLDLPLQRPEANSFEFFEMGGGCLFAIESPDCQLLMSGEPHNGIRLWTTPEPAAELCQRHKSLAAYKVSRIGFRELCPLLKRMKVNGNQHVILDLMPTGGGRVATVDEVIKILEDAIKRANSFRVEMDECVRTLVPPQR